MMDNPDCFALMLGGENHVAGMSFASSSEDAVIVSSRWRQKVGVFGVAWLWRNSVRSSCAPTPGTPSHARRGKLALMKLISILTLSPEIIRKKDNEATAAATGAPE